MTGRTSSWRARALVVLLAAGLGACGGASSTSTTDEPTPRSLASPEAYAAFLEAELLMGEDLYEEAVDALRLAVRVDEESVFLWLALADALDEAEAWEDALDALDRAAEEAREAPPAEPAPETAMRSSRLKHEGYRPPRPGVSP